MKNISEYIESGILELFVAGTLSEKENREVVKNLEQHQELQKEVELIEKTIITLSSAIAPSNTQPSFDALLSSLSLEKEKTGQVIPLFKRLEYIGWVAMFICLLGGLIWKQVENNELREKTSSLLQLNQDLEKEIISSREQQEETKQLIAVLRDRAIITVPLNGQTNFEASFAKVYWDQTNQSIYLDAQGLPVPPEGMEYQVWSLTLDPLSPTSIGMLSDFESDSDKIFRIENQNQSQAFGITLEPKGGSENPTMEQLYTLGVVET